MILYWRPNGDTSVYGNGDQMKPGRPREAPIDKDQRCAAGLREEWRRSCDQRLLVGQPVENEDEEKIADRHAGYKPVQRITHFFVVPNGHDYQSIAETAY